jgi:hypothetical protein
MITKILEVAHRSTKPWPNLRPRRKRFIHHFSLTTSDRTTRHCKMGQERMSPVCSQDKYYELGSFGRNVSTNSKDAQEWFNQGLIWTYALHHEEARLASKMPSPTTQSAQWPYWGLAYSLGPNYNKPWEVAHERFLRMESAICTGNGICIQRLLRRF